MNTIKYFVGQYWLPTVVVAAWVGWFWRSARRLSRRTTKKFEPPRGARKNVHITAPFRRDEFVAKAEIASNRMAKALVIPVAMFVASPPAILAVSRLVPSVPPGFSGGAMETALVLTIASMAALVLRASSIQHRDGPNCPACGMELYGMVGGLRSRHTWSIDDWVLEKGKCPGCGEQLLDPSEVGPASHTSTRAEQAAGVALVAVLLVILGAYVHFSAKYIDEANLTHCHNRYARALSAADSIAVDSTRVGPRRSRISCGELRLRASLDGSEISSN